MSKTYIDRDWYEGQDNDKKYLINEIIRSEAEQGNLIVLKDRDELLYSNWGDAVVTNRQFEGMINLPTIDDLCRYTYRQFHGKNINEQTFEILGDQSIKCTQDPTAYRMEAYTMRRREEVGATAYINKDTNECTVSYIANTGIWYEQKTTLDKMNELVNEIARTANVEVKVPEKVEQEERKSGFKELIENVKEKFNKTIETITELREAMQYRRKIEEERSRESTEETR